LERDSKIVQGLPVSIVNLKMGVNFTTHQLKSDEINIKSNMKLLKLNSLE